MSVSFHEKSLWVVLAGLVAGFTFYFHTALAMRTDDVMPQHVALFAVAVAVLVVTQVAGHALVVLLDRRTLEDERDRQIALMGTRNGAYALATGVFVALCTAVVSKGNFVPAHVLLAAWVIAQCVAIASELVLHRRGS